MALCATAGTTKPCKARSDTPAKRRRSARAITAALIAMGDTPASKPPSLSLPKRRHTGYSDVVLKGVYVISAPASGDLAKRHCENHAQRSKVVLAYQPRASRRIKGCSLAELSRAEPCLVDLSLADWLLAPASPVTATGPTEICPVNGRS